MGVKEYIKERTTGEMFKDVDKTFLEMEKIFKVMLDATFAQLNKRTKFKFDKKVKELETKHGLQAIGELKALVHSDPELRRAMEWLFE